MHLLRDEKFFSDPGSGEEFSVCIYFTYKVSSTVNQIHQLSYLTTYALSESILNCKFLCGFVEMYGSHREDEW